MSFNIAKYHCSRIVIYLAFHLGQGWQTMAKGQIQPGACWNTVTPVSLHGVYSCFCTTKAALSSCDQDHMIDPNKQTPDYRSRACKLTTVPPGQRLLLALLKSIPQRSIPSLPLHPFTSLLGPHCLMSSSVHEAQVCMTRPMSFPSSRLTFSNPVVQIHIEPSGT